MTDARYGIVPDEHCEMMINEGEVAKIGRRVRKAASEATDMLLVYFAGHGLADSRQELYLTLTDTDYESPAFSALEYNKLRQAVLDSPASAKIIILDCCYSGIATTGTMAAQTDADLIGQVEVHGTYVLASAPRYGLARVVDGENYTAFTGRLLRLMREGIVGDPELLTIDSLYRQLLIMMRAEGLPEPHQRSTGVGNHLALSRNRAFAVTPAKVTPAQEAASTAGKSVEHPDPPMGRQAGQAAGLSTVRPRAGSRWHSRRLAALTAAVVAGAAIVVGLHLIMPNTARAGTTSISFQFPARHFTDGLTVDRRWTLDGQDGSLLAEKLTASNSSKTVVLVSLAEPIPVAITSNLRTITFEAQPQVLRSEHVAKWNLRLLPHETLSVGYRTAVRPAGLLRSRLTRWADELNSLPVSQRSWTASGLALKSLTVKPAAVTLSPEGSRRLVLSGMLVNHQHASAAMLAKAKWVTSDRAIVTVSPTGEIMARGLGKARVTVSLDGIRTSVTVLIKNSATAGTGPTNPAPGSGYTPPSSTTHPSPAPTDTGHPL